MTHSTICRVCFSLNKSTSYRSLCLSLNSFCDVVVVSCSVSDFLWPHGLQHTRLPCPSPFPRACSNSCPLSQWWYPTISSSVVPFSSCFQSFPASGSFLMLFASGQNIGASVSASVLPINIQDWFPLGRTGWISLQSKGLSRVFSNTTVQKHQFFSAQLSLWPNSHIHTWLTTGKTIALTIWTFVGKVMSLLFNTLPRFIIFFLWRDIKNLSFIKSCNLVCDQGWKTMSFAQVWVPHWGEWFQSGQKKKRKSQCHRVLGLVMWQEKICRERQFCFGHKEFGIFIAMSSASGNYT